MKKLLLSLLLIAGVSATTFASGSSDKNFSASLTSYAQQDNQDSDVASRQVANIASSSIIDENNQSYRDYYYGFGTSCGYTAMVHSNQPLSDRFITNLSVAIEYAFCSE